MEDAPTESAWRPGAKKQRATALAPGDVDWIKLLKLATGCTNEYIQVSDVGVRFMNGLPRGTPEASQGDPDAVAAMQEGIPVLFYVHGQGFVQRILKVDNRLSFCYIFSVANRLDNNRLQLLPLHEVRVLTHIEAMEVCSRLGVDDSHMTADSTVVVLTGNGEGLENDNDELAKQAFVFIAPPHTLLKERLQACSRAKNKARVVKPRDAERAGGASVEVVLRMDGVRFKDPLAVYKEPKYMTLEVQFLTASGHPGGRLVQYRLRLPLLLKRVPDEISRIEAQASSLTAVDRARVVYVLRELSMVHSWARSFKRLYQVDFYTFMAADLSAAEKRRDEEEGGEDLSALRTPEAIAHICQLPALAGQDHYSLVTIRTLLVALQQSMELDNDVIVMTHRLRTEEERVANRSSVIARPAAKVAAKAPQEPSVSSIEPAEPSSSRSQPAQLGSSSAALLPTEKAGGKADEGQATSNSAQQAGEDEAEPAKANRSSKRASTWGSTSPKEGSMLGRISSWSSKLF